MLHMLCTNCDPLADWASSLAHACPWLRCHGLSLHQQRASKLLEPSMAPNWGKWPAHFMSWHSSQQITSPWQAQGPSRSRTRIDEVTAATLRHAMAAPSEEPGLLVQQCQCQQTF